MTASLSPTNRRFIVFGLVLGLFSWTFGDVIFRDRNFIYRDAGHFYYPLLKLVQDEWRAGRWPLWNPYENGGMPLLGNPASAVLYPPRIVIFQWLPISYGTAYKWYILMHVLLSAATAYAMARNWKATDFAAGLAAISYAFGAVVMFQYCNVIFLVGAAWVPLGLLATDRLLSVGSWRWAVMLGLVLAMQVLGGDPEAAYVTGGLAALYLIFLDLKFGLGLTGALGTSLLIKLLVGNESIKSLDGVMLALIAFALLVASPVAWWWIRLKQLTSPASTDAIRMKRRRRWCLLIAAAVAVGVSAVQWLPTWEFSRISLRAAGGIHHEAYAFWVAPWRFVEMLWPNVSGHQFPINTRWLDIFAVGDRTWEPSLYFGVLTLVLSLSAWRIRAVPPWQRWLSLTLVLSIWAAAGPAGGLSWYWKMANRVEAIMTNDPAAAPTNPANAGSTKGREGPPTELETPAGGLYWLLVQLLPGFGGFRYPAKLMTFAAAAFSALAAVGWDRLFSYEDPRKWRVIASVAFTSFVLALVALVTRPHLADWLQESWLARGAPYYGPLLGAEAAWCIVRSFVTTAVVLTLVFGVCCLTRLRFNVEVVAAIVLAVVAVDIGLANQWMVATASQSQFDTEPRVMEIIRDAEAAEGTQEPLQPFRIHRISIWSPLGWFERVSADQGEEVFRWEKDTIQPKYGLLTFEGSGRLSYTINQGTLEPYDYWWFFSSFYSNTTPVPRSIVYHPMRGYDMWGAKYFVLPKGANDKDEHRGIRTFLMHSRLIDESDMEEDDFQVRRNDSYFPRAWIVHRLIYRKPIQGLAKADRMDRMREILYSGFDGLWIESELEGRVQDPREVAWIEHPDPGFVASLQAQAADPETDRCQIVSYEPDRVEIEVETSARGVMVLADLYFTGWQLNVDGKPTEILRANRVMRGVPLSPGKHRVVFMYNPLSFRVGGLITLLSLGAIAASVTFPWLRRQSGAATQAKPSVEA